MRTLPTLKTLCSAAIATGLLLASCNGVELLVGAEPEGEPHDEGGVPSLEGGAFPKGGPPGTLCEAFTIRQIPLPSELASLGLRVGSIDSHFVYATVERSYSRGGSVPFDTTWGMMVRASRDSADFVRYGAATYPGQEPPARFERPSPWETGPHPPSVLSDSEKVYVLEPRTVKSGGDAGPAQPPYQEHGLTLNTHDLNNPSAKSRTPIDGFACAGTAIHAVGGDLYIATRLPERPQLLGSVEPIRLTVLPAQGPRRESTFGYGLVRCAFDDDALYFIRPGGEDKVSLVRRSLADGSQVDLAADISPRALVVAGRDVYFYAKGGSAIVRLDKRTGAELGRIPASGTGDIVVVDGHIYWWAGNQLMHGHVDGTCVAPILSRSGTSTLVGDRQHVYFIDPPGDSASLYEIGIYREPMGP